MSGSSAARLEWHAARRLAFDVASAQPARTVPLECAIGRRLATDVVALCDLPHYASSAMDGWAVAGEPPWQLVTSATLASGEAGPIVTGGLIPPGSDAVLRTESGTVHDSLLTPGESAHPDEPRAGQHIRAAGEEARESEVLIEAGTVLNPAHIALAAGGGHDSLLVDGVPSVALLLTGDEVVETGVPAPGHVRDSFGPMLPALIAGLGGRVIRSQRLGDDVGELVAAIRDAQDAGAVVIITTGGTGHSPVDQLHASLRSVDAEIRIDGIAMRPGGPSLLARLADGQFLIGLPGNPLAAIIGALTLGRPLLAALGGRSEPRLDQVRVADPVSGRRGSVILVPYALRDGAASPTRWHGSGMLRGLAEADGILVVPPDGVAAGDAAESIALPWR